MKRLSFIRRRSVAGLLAMAAVLVVLAGLTAALVLADAPVRAQPQSSREGRIAFIFGESGVDHPAQLGVRDADGRNARPLKPYSVSGVSWAADGRSIAFGSYETGISTMNIDGRPRQRRVIRNGSYPAWSPNGRAITFDRGSDFSAPGPRGVWVFNLSDRRQRRIVRNGVYPDWSPDGKKLVFTRARGDSGSGISVVEVSSKKQRRLTRKGSDPRWSPDGSQIVFDRCGAASCFIWVMRSDGTKLRRLFEGESPAWSPTGREIAFWDEDPKHGITRVRLDGSHRRRLPAGPFPPIYCPCWGIDWSRPPHARR